MGSLTSIEVFISERSLMPSLLLGAGEIREASSCWLLLLFQGWFCWFALQFLCLQGLCFILFIWFYLVLNILFAFCIVSRDAKWLQRYRLRLRLPSSSVAHCPIPVVVAQILLWLKTSFLPLLSFLKGRESHEEINITFTLPAAWNSDDCVLHGHCEQVVFTTCMTVTAASNVFPVTV